MARREEPTIFCPKCTKTFPIEEGYPRAVVAVCYATGWSCDMKQWGSASTRRDYAVEARDAKSHHAVQLDPPLSDEEKAALEQRPEGGAAA